MATSKDIDQSDDNENHDHCEDVENVPEKKTTNVNRAAALHYEVEDNPPIYMCILCGFQVAISNIVFIISFSVLISNLICADASFNTRLYSTAAVSSGVCTIIQTLLGVRLPIFQGPSILYLIPYLNAANDPHWGCNLANTTVGTLNLTDNEATKDDSLMLVEWRKAQGSMLLATFAHILVGSLGIGGLMLRVIGPITITVVITLLGISAHFAISGLAEVHWGLALFSTGLIVIFSQYINNIKVPLPTWTKRTGVKWARYPLFELFPILIGVLAGWLLSYIFTASGVFSDNPKDIEFEARSDYGFETIQKASIINLPYPGQYWPFGFKLSYFITFIACHCGSMAESVGDYIQTSVPCRVPRPPPHAINRGILVEGIGTIFSALMGAGHATTSFSNMIGLISITKVASRRVFVYSGMITILMGIFGKLGAVFVTIPKPVLAGPVFIGLAMLVGAGLSNLRTVDLNSSRNIAVLGIAVMGGVVVPFWLGEHPGVVRTGSDTLNTILEAVLGTPLLLGGIIACFLDNTLPGTTRSRGMEVDVSTLDDTAPVGDGVFTDKSQRQYNPLRVYEISFITDRLPRWRIWSYMPFLPKLTINILNSSTASRNGDNETL